MKVAGNRRFLAKNVFLREEHRSCATPSGFQRGFLLGFFVNTPNNLLHRRV